METITQRVLSRPTHTFWKTLQWRLECLSHSVIEWIAVCLPGSWVFHLGEMLGSLAWYLLPQRRRIVLRNLRIAFAGEKSLPEMTRMTKEIFRRSGANLISVAHTARLSPEKLAKVIHIENRELLENALADGKGVVVLLAHMGNWELLSRLLYLFPAGSKAGAFYRPLNNPLLDAKVLARRQADGSRLFSKRDPFHKATGFLREGGIVGILADQRVGMKGEVVPFFGRFTRVSPLPSLLARRAKAEVLALALITERPGKWKAVFLPVAKPGTTPQCMHALESAMKMCPTDVFWLQERWKVTLKPYRPFQQWLSPVTSSGVKPHRALIWFVGASESWRPAESWFHPDVVYEAVIADNTNPPDWLPNGIAIHKIPCTHSQSYLGLFVRTIDAKDILPYDFIITHVDSMMLSQVAATELIPLFQLP